ncbi:response regulator [Idiomarina tyrosinivorans]|uniref:Response regulator n=1 Tax=Idiomarina tyrosinivorans TaxID=1445662 RepID=A0A432ZPD9_9GAMM|nr:response regulator [Idiomarina tyrosinivorans]RUO79785.1 response regulator [Idiomarina tyrosinivorans]
MSRATIVVIEDDPVFQSLLQQYLANLDFTVIAASTGEEGLRLCRESEPDIVLCDLMLPDINGLQVIEQLLGDASDAPIIVISASEEMSDIREAVRLGAWDYLVKPVNDLHVLDFAIENCLHRHHLEQSYESEVWELDDHIDVIYQDDAMIDRLSQELVPSGPLQVGDYRFSQQQLDPLSRGLWIEYRPLLDGQVLVIIASVNAPAEQKLLPLLVLKTLIDPLIRQHLAGTDHTILYPEQLLTHVNLELCHSKIRSAFDVVCGIVKTQQHEWCWAQAGDKIVSSSEGKPDLALGIWQHAQYRTHRAFLPPHSHLQLKLDSAELVIDRA